MIGVGREKTRELRGDALLADVVRAEHPDEVVLLVLGEPRPVVLVLREVDLLRPPVLVLPQVIELLGVHEPLGAPTVIAPARIGLLCEFLKRRHLASLLWFDFPRAATVPPRWTPCRRTVQRRRPHG